MNSRIENYPKFASYIVMLAFLKFAFIPYASTAQTPMCGTDEIISRHIANYDPYTISITPDLINSCPLPNNGAYRIPVVVHVLYNTTAGNISEAQIHDAIEKLNIDFLASDGIGDNTQISFALANFDPDGHCTNGITRHEIAEPYGNSIDPSADVALKDNVRWPNDKYLNIWVVECIFFGGGCELSGGYAYLPCIVNSVTVPPPFPKLCEVAGQSAFIDPYDGVVIVHPEFGRIGTAQNSNRQSILTHEVGHWLNLYHTFSPNGMFLPPGNLWLACHDQTLGQIQGDFIEDTPATEGTGGGIDCSTILNSCSYAPDIDLIDNFMDYAGECHNSFTQDQTEAMKTCLGENRPLIWCDDNLISTGLLNYFPTNATLEINNNILCVGEQNSFQLTACLLGESDYPFTTILNFDPQMLPSGVTITGGSFVNGQFQLPNELTPDGGCGIATLTLSADALIANQIMIIPVTITVVGDCNNSTFVVDVAITIQYCNFSCACTGSGQINIAADPNGTLWSDYALQHNLPDELNFSVHNGCLAINGKLIIDRDVTITGCTNLYMQPCSEIVVGNTNISGNYPTLNFNNNNVSGCIRMWKGITVNPMCKLFATENMISDAQFAIHAISSSTAQFIPVLVTTVDIEDNEFVRNHVGVIFDNSFNLSFPEVWHTPLINNSFIGHEQNKSLLPPCGVDLPNHDTQFGYAGIVALYAPITIGTPGLSGYVNTFSNLRNGIIADRNWMTVRRAKFENIVGYITTSGSDPSYAFSTGVGVLHNRGVVTVSNSEFNGCGHGVFAKNSFVSVYQNTMPDVHAGIRVRESYGLSIWENQDIKFRDFGIYCSDLSGWIGFTKFQIYHNQLETLISDNGPNTKAGIIMNNSNNFDVQGNSRICANTIYIKDFVDGINVGNLNNWLIDSNNIYFQNHFLGLGHITSGIKLTNSHLNYLYNNNVGDESNIVTGKINNGFSTSSSSENEYCCNNSIGTWAGISFLGSCELTELRHQSMEDHVVALICNQNTFISDQPDLFNFPLSNHSNLFNQGSGYAIHNGSGTQISDSQFPVFSNQQPDWPEQLSPPSIDPYDQNNWFFISGNSANDCQECAIPPARREKSPKIDDTELHFVDGSYLDNTSPTESITWEGRLRLFERLSKNPLLIGESSTVDDFYDDARLSAIGSFYTVENAIQNLTNLPSELQDSIDLAYQALQEKETDIVTKLDELANAQNMADSIIIYNEVDLLRHAGFLDFSAFMTFQNQAASIRTQKAIEALDLNAALPNTDALESNRKTINRIYLQTLGQGIGSLNTQQFSDVKDIANLCPLEGGATAVYRARSLYQLKEYKSFDDIDICFPSEERNQFNISRSEMNSLWIHPNPTTNDLIVSLPMGISPDATIILKINDMNGKTILSKQVTDLENTIKIDVSQFANGVYFCTVIACNTAPNSVKFIIQH